MASSTRADIKKRVRRRLQVGTHSEMDGDPLSLDTIIDEVANEVSRNTRIYMRRYQTDITGTPNSPMAEVCIPELYEIISLMATLGMDNVNDDKLLLDQVDIKDANRYLRQWREKPAAGQPRLFIYAPPNIWLYPQPDYACTGGLVFEGYASPLASWGTPTSSPDLPERTISTIVYGVAARWAEEYPQIPGMIQRAATNKARYDELVGELETEVNRQADDARHHRFFSGW